MLAFRFYGKCVFCGKGGHDVLRCTNPNLRNRIYELEARILLCRNIGEMYRVISVYKTEDLRVLGIRVKSPAGLPRIFLERMLCKYYQNYLEDIAETIATEISCYEDEDEYNNGVCL